MSRRRVAYLNARLIDPESGLDAPGALLTEGETIADLGPRLFNGGDVPANAEVVDCGGRALCPGLVDMRVFVGEPGAEHKETLASAGQAAAAHGPQRTEEAGGRRSSRFRLGSSRGNRLRRPCRRLSLLLEHVEDAHSRSRSFGCEVHTSCDCRCLLLLDYCFSRATAREPFFTNRSSTPLTNCGDCRLP